MTADRWARAVRERLGLGRLLPLGEAADGAWLAERAAGAVLRRAAASVAAVGPVTLRIALADPDRAGEPAVPAPPGALPPGPLRIEAALAATADAPLPVTAAALRAALFTAAREALGLVVTEVDLRVTALLDQAPAAVPPPEEQAAGLPPAGAVATAAAQVPGVVALTGVLGAPVHDEGGHIRIELATAREHRALDVARAVRTAVTADRQDRPTVTVVITAVV
ncbi:hypothetical protein NLX86_25245 [Streptomyces sp. A3M-1-3]|uniref:hypothetical protein n=1 Tax=Streptomyces sp. A3M-1-3 TaxID=2962044 RepID=UPI0020B6E98D|nr:hypothetical protein [Streptomyces sp. A3M-1-3]MCP3821278.1 hypothetical protein [Streptomyces sp. A3M-1-3]